MCNTGCPNKFWSHFYIIMHEMINSNAHLRPLHRARVLQKKKIVKMQRVTVWVFDREFVAFGD